MHAYADRADRRQGRDRAADFVQARRHPCITAPPLGRVTVGGCGVTYERRRQRARNVPTLYRTAAGQIQQVENAGARRLADCSLRPVTRLTAPFAQGLGSLPSAQAEARSRDGRKRMANPIADALAFARRPRNSVAKPSATRQSGEVAVDDITSRQTVKQFKWVGTRPIRPDGVPKVTGLAQYGADLAMPGMLVGHILRSPHAHARIRSIDTSKAAVLPGVKAVVTSADFPEQKFAYVGPERVAQNFWHMTRNIMAREKALYEGHAVAAVAATSKAIADEALSLIAVDYEVLPHVIDVDEAMKPDAPLLFPDLITRGVEPPPQPSNISKRVEFRLGDLEAGFAAADEIVEMSFKTAPVHQAYIEPQGCVARCDADGQGELWSSSQGHFVVRAYTAQLLGMKLGDLRVYPAEIGGAFGGKTVIYVEPVAVVLARKSGHPVKIVMSREDVFRATGPTSGSSMTVKIGVRRDGTIVAADGLFKLQ